MPMGYFMLTVFCGLYDGKDTNYSGRNQMHGKFICDGAGGRVQTKESAKGWRKTNKSSFRFRQLERISRDDILFNGARCGRKVHANLENPAATHGEGGGVTLVFDLLQGFIGRTVELEFKDVNILIGLYGHV